MQFCDDEEDNGDDDCSHLQHYDDDDDVLLIMIIIEFESLPARSPWVWHNWHLKRVYWDWYIKLSNSIQVMMMMMMVMMTMMIIIIELSPQKKPTRQTLNGVLGEHGEGPSCKGWMTWWWWWWWWWRQRRWWSWIMTIGSKAPSNSHICFWVTF